MKKVQEQWLTFIEKITEGKSKYKCRCGKEIILYNSDIKRGKVSCGCWANTVRNKINKEILEEYYVNQKKSPQEICDIFNISSTTTIKKALKRYSLIKRTRLESHRLNTKRCVKFKKFYGEISGSYFCQIRTGAKARDLEFRITIEQIWELFLKQNKKCILTGRDISFPKISSWRDRKNQTASLDRKDSNKGYTIDNVQWVHKDINRFKWDYSEKEFYQLCKEVYLYNMGKYDS